jgi:hypothetical protein
MQKSVAKLHIADTRGIAHQQKVLSWLQQYAIRYLGHLKNTMDFKFTYVVYCTLAKAPPYTVKT